MGLIESQIFTNTCLLVYIFSKKTKLVCAGLMYSYLRFNLSFFLMESRLGFHINQNIEKYFKEMTENKLFSSICSFSNFMFTFLGTHTSLNPKSPPISHPSQIWRYSNTSVSHGRVSQKLFHVLLFTHLIHLKLKFRHIWHSKQSNQSINKINFVDTFCQREFLIGESWATTI